MEANSRSQKFIFGQLTSEGGGLEPSRSISYPSLAVGIPNTLLCFEMMLVAIVHTWAYPSAPYRLSLKTRKSANIVMIPATDGYDQTTSHNRADDQSPGQSFETRSAEYAEGRATTDFCAGEAGSEEIPRHYGGILGWRAMVDAINILDIVLQVSSGFQGSVKNRQARTDASSRRRDVGVGTSRVSND